MIIRLSQKLADKLHQTRLRSLPSEPDMLADWYGHLFVFSRCQYIITVNTATILTAVFPGNGINNIEAFMQRFRTALADVCRDIEATHLYGRISASADSSIRTAKAENKYVAACMNEQIFMAAAILEQGDISCFNLAKRLNENLHAYIHYRRPREAFLRLAGTKKRRAQEPLLTNGEELTATGGKRGS